MFLASSCIPYKNLVYLNEGRPDLDQINPVLPGNSNINTPIHETHRIRPEDVLNINVKTITQNTLEVFETERMAMGGGMGGGGATIGLPQFFLQGYIVSDSGTIKMPMVGEIAVAGLTLLEAENKLDKALQEYLPFTSVRVRLVNFRITVLGEVRQQGVKYIFDSNVTLPQVLSLSGVFPVSDLRRVRVIRRTGQGSSTSVFINLANPRVLESPYYWLQPDDIVIVQPLPRKALDNNLALIGAVASVGSLTLLILNLFR